MGAWPLRCRWFVRQVDVMLMGIVANLSSRSVFEALQFVCSFQLPCDFSLYFWSIATVISDSLISLQPWIKPTGCHEGFLKASMKDSGSVRALPQPPLQEWHRILTPLTFSSLPRLFVFF